jgi:hypothetical protein
VETKHFELVPPGKSVLLVPLAASTAVTVGLLVSLLHAKPPPPWPVYLILVLVPVLALLLSLEIFRRDVQLTEQGLRVRTVMWPATTPIAEFDLERAEIANLNLRPELMPRLKLVGSRMPGYRAGLFTLRDKRRASVILTDLERVLVLPKRNGSVLMLSVERPEALLQALRRRG